MLQYLTTIHAVLPSDTRSAYLTAGIIIAPLVSFVGEAVGSAILTFYHKRCN